MKIVLVAWVGYRAGMQCLVRSSSVATVPYSMKNIITYFQLSPDVQQSITTVLQCSITKTQICEIAALDFIVLNLIYQAITSVHHSYEEKTRCYRTKPDQLYPRAFSLRPNWVLFVFTVFKGLIGEKMLALQLRTSAT